MMAADDFLYDASMPTVQFGHVNIGKGLWPYSFDYKSTQVLKDYLLDYPITW